MFSKDRVSKELKEKFTSFNSFILFIKNKKWNPSKFISSFFKKNSVYNEKLS